MYSNVSIITDRLIIREFREDDMEAVHSYASDPEVVRFMVWGPNSIQDTEDFLQRVSNYRKEKPRYRFEMALILERELIGACNLTVTDYKSREAYIGYCLNKKYWGNGYATEAATSLIKFGFEELDLHRIYATCDVRNIASKKVLQKLAMIEEGYLREHKRIRGEWRSSFLFSILEWEYDELYR